MNNIEVCVVITTYKRKIEVLKRAVDSVLNQIFTEYSLVIVDDSPDLFEDRDKVAKYVKEIADHRVVYIQNEENMGACKSRNREAHYCDSEFLAFLDDDDEWLPDKLEKQIKALNSNNNAGLVYSNAEIVNEVYNSRRKRFDDDFCMQGRIFSKLFYRNIIGSSTFPLVRREVFEKVGGFDENLPALQDWDLWIRIAEITVIEYIPDVLCKYYYYEGERISAHPEKRAMAFEIIVKKQESFFEQNPKSAADFYLAGVFFYSNSSNLSKALVLWLRAVSLHPTNIKRNIDTGIKAIGRIFVKAKVR